ncbi:MAG TPA: SDR family oxidoreductase [Amycolatopsis sp.]|nr:SDR family oxidoreductase [Amycolatopsis sp.]
MAGVIGGIGDDEFAGQSAIITGGGTGIGRATALALASRGADITLASRKVDNLEQVAKEIAALGRRALVVTTDVRRPEDIAAMAERHLAEFGACEVLVNNAGGSYQMPFADWTLDAWEKMIDLNLRAVFLAMQAIGPSMVANGRGAIVNVSSRSAANPNPMVGPYGAAKAGVEYLTTTMAAAWGPAGVRVNCVRVGTVESEGFLRAMAQAGRKVSEVGANSALGRNGQPSEIANVIMFLASSAASFVSGQTLAADGGPLPHGGA